MGEPVPGPVSRCGELLLLVSFSGSGGSEPNVVVEGPFLDDPSGESRRLPGQAIGLGLNMVASASLFGFLGHWVGGKVGGQDVLTLLGIFIGAGAGFYSLYLHLVVRPELIDEDKKTRE